MKKRWIVLILMIFSIMITMGCSSEDKHIKQVKNGYLNNHHEITVGEAFAGFFGEPKWKYFKSDKNRDVVEFTGKCKYHDVEVKAKMQFVFSNNDAFKIEYLAFNDVPQNMLMLAGLLTKVYETPPVIDKKASNKDFSQRDIVIEYSISQSGQVSVSQTSVLAHIGQKIVFKKQTGSKDGERIMGYKNDVMDEKTKVIVRTGSTKYDIVPNYSDWDRKKTIIINVVD